jgi:hypothetical protein
MLSKKKTVELPKRSQRQAKQTLANIPPARRAEVLLSQRLDMVPKTDSISETARKACEEYFGSTNLSQSRREAVNHLFPSLGRVTSSMGVLAA